MAFSTQKDFLHVGFMNERPEATCLRLEGVKLKTYASTPDERAWSMSKGEQAQYLIDLVACRMYQGGECGDGFREHLPARSPRRGQRGPCGTCVGHETLQGEDVLTSGLGDDSVLNTALGEMTKLEKLLAEKDELKSQLETSQEQLACVKAEKETITAILNNEHRPEIACDLRNAYRRLQCSGKLDKNEDNELKKILCDLIKREKAYKCLDAQNGYLRRLIEKLTLRSQLSSIPNEPEKCTDVKYLQCEVNNLRREVTLLRSLEDKQLEKETVSRGCQGTSNSNQDADNIAKILAERNALRDKCKSFVAIEAKIVQWKQDSEQLQCLRSEACCAMKKKDEEIQDLHDEIEDLQFELQKVEKCCKAKDQEGETLCTSVECLKDENRRLREELCRCNCDLKKITMLQAQVQCLSGELCEKNCIIEQYDMQFQQLLCVIEDLQKKSPCDIRGLQDVDSQTYNKDIELLACSTRDTLDQISKELECQKSLEMELVKTDTALKGSLELFDKPAAPGESCADQVKRLNELIESMKKENESLKKDIERGPSAPSSDGQSGDLRKAQETNDELNKALRECQAKVKDQEEQIGKLNTQAEKLTSELESSKANIKQVGKVVEEINGVQTRNENLQNVLGAVDYQKELADLQKQLENERKKNSECEAQNKNLQAEITKAKASADAAGSDAAKRADSGDAAAKAAAAKAAADAAAAKAAADAAAAKGAADAAAAKGAADAAAAKAAADAAAAKAAADAAARGSADEAAKAAAKAAAEEAARAAAASAAASADAKQARRSSKLNQLQKAHDAQRNADRSKYEKEIAGHQMSNEVLRKSITKMAQLSGQRAIELERELRIVLETFSQEICKWRCERPVKLNKLQEICKKIIDCGIEYLTYKELVYLHQQLADAAMRLKPRGSSPYVKRELTCCKCSGDICQVPMIPKENERLLLEKLSILERDIQSARENLRRIKLEQDPDSTDTDQMELDTMRPKTYRLNRCSRSSSSRRVHCTIKEEFEVPTKD